MRSSFIARPPRTHILPLAAGLAVSTSLELRLLMPKPTSKPAEGVGPQEPEALAKSLGSQPSANVPSRSQSPALSARSRAVETGPGRAPLSRVLGSRGPCHRHVGGSPPWKGPDHAQLPRWLFGPGSPARPRRGLPGFESKIPVQPRGHQVSPLFMGDGTTEGV